MHYLNRPEYQLSYIEWDPNLTFKIDEACHLLYHEVIRIEDKAYLPLPPNDKVGIVVGVITMNEEIEVLVKFMSGIEQLVKTEFCSDYIMVPD